MRVKGCAARPFQVKTLPGPARAGQEWGRATADKVAPAALQQDTVGFKYGEGSRSARLSTD